MRNAGLFICFLLFLISCKEEPLAVPLISPESSARRVLIEEFTGVRCVNCPQGTDEILNLQGLYGENVLAVAIHAGFFAQKYPDSKFDFKTEKGQQIESWLGAPIGYPSAVINRRKFVGEQNFQLPRQSWAGHIANELKKDPAVSINIETTFDPFSRNLSVKVFVVAEENISGESRITIMLTEDNIIDPQANVAESSGRTTAYNHKHVLRDILTSFDGNTLSQRMIAGDIIERNFNYIIPGDESGWWKTGDMHVLAFVTAVSAGGPGEVLNVNQVSIN